jgi:hypothetical protein
MEHFSVTTNVPFDEARDFLTKHKNVDGEPAGLSPITMRWLNKKNTFVNVGIEDFEKKTRIYTNNNSYGVNKSDLTEIVEVLEEKFEPNKIKEAK